MEVLVREGMQGNKRIMERMNECHKERANIFKKKKSIIVTVTSRLFEQTPALLRLDF